MATVKSVKFLCNCVYGHALSCTRGLESSALTTRPRRLGANLRRDATSRLLFFNQSVLADFDDRKKKLPDLRLVAFQARVKMEKNTSRANVQQQPLSTTLLIGGQFTCD